MTEVKKTVARKAFEFTKSYEEVELAGKTYKIEFNDEKVLQYNKNFDKFQKESQRIHKIDAAEMPVKEQQGLFFEMQKLVEGLVKELLGEDAYGELYAASGNSLIGMMDVVVYLSDVVGERMEHIQSDRKNKYLVKPKK